MIRSEVASCGCDGPVYGADLEGRGCFCFLYSAVYFDSKDYESAIKALEAGNQAAGGSVGELLYFLGQAHFKAGNIEKARGYANKARTKGYPLRYLSRKLAEHDAQKQPGK